MKLAASLDVNGNKLKDGNKEFTLPSATGTLATIADIPQGSWTFCGSATAISSNYTTLTVNGSPVVASSGNIGNVYQLETDEYVSNGQVWVRLGEKPILHVGTRAERLAYSASDGDEWNEVEYNSMLQKNELLRYVYLNSTWIPLADAIIDDSERILFNMTSEDGLINFENKVILLRRTGKEDVRCVLNSSGTAVTFVQLGETYTLIYPIIDGYEHIPNDTFTASINARYVTKQYEVYEDDSDVATVVLLEQSIPSNWTRRGNLQAIDDILDYYGAYVIDDANKMYARLDPENYSQFKDVDSSTGEATYTAWSGTWGNAFRRLPRVYYRVSHNYETARDYLSVSLQNISNHYWEEDWIGVYKGSVVSNVLVSRPNLTTTQSQTMSSFWTYAQNNNVNNPVSNYGLVNYFDHCKINALHLAKFGNSDSSQTMGPGLQDAGQNYWAHTTGYTVTLGEGTGSMPYGTTAYKMNKLFGIEDLAGSTWEFRPNIRFDTRGTRAVVYEGNQVSNTATGRTFTKLNNASQAYVTHMVLGTYFDLIPTTVGGTSATYWCDGTWASTSGEILLVGGDSNNGSIAGLSCTASDSAFSDSATHLGARLSFVGDVNDQANPYTLVTGAYLASLH